MQSTNISIESYGNISIITRFDSKSDLKNFKTKSKSIFSDVQGSFDFVQTNFSGVNIFAYETENTSTQITPH